MKKSVLILFFSCCFCSIIFGQINYPTKDSSHIFWQPNLKITYNDYIGEPTQEIKKIMDEYGFSASASVGIWSILDIPKKKKDRYKKMEKVYFAPAFERTTSFTETHDSLEIVMQNTYFDICEIWARWARKELANLQKEMNATGVLTTFYMTVKDEMNENRIKMYKAYFKDVFADKKENSFGEWRNTIDKLLEETKEWATTPEECFRLMIGKPLEKDYIQAPTVIGNLKFEKN